MAKDFPDPDGAYAYKPSAPDDVPVLKIVPTVPASQSERPQLRPVLPIGD